ncbi:hypothetical protein M0R45_036750 [Rubus argutus]|uniref:Uncharacterized protein n=1 Tax=Rubus argutus TaxID=59490 RepID=A0AAW1VXY3_RUBAR
MFTGNKISIQTGIGTAIVIAGVAVYSYLMAKIEEEKQTVGSVLCCKCGIPMAPNAANMCVKCLRYEADITEVVRVND